MRRDEIKAVVIAALRAGRQAAEAEVDRIVLGSPGAWYVNGELVTTDSGDGLDPRDGGTCNFDDVVLRLPRTCPSRVVSEWIAEAYYDTKEREPRKWFGRGWFVLAGNAGHAGLNTRCRDAFQRAAEAEVAKRGAGGVVKFSGYFQAD